MGRLNRIIEIQHLTITRDAFGSEIQASVHMAKVWAEKLQLKPAERFIETSARTVIQSMAQFKILQRGDVDEAMRVIDDYGAT